MIQAKDGDKVKVHYTGKLGNGKVVSTSKGGPPLEVNIGSRGHIPGFEMGIIGLKPGETKTIRVPPDQAHGPRRPELMVDVPKSNFPEDIKLVAGKRVRMKKEGGGHIQMTIKEIDEDTVTVDANHPLAGEMLVFEVQLVEVI
jgi:peptidylprolyl isomerase